MDAHLNVVTHEACPRGSVFVTDGRNAVRVDLASAPIESVLGRDLLSTGRPTVSRAELNREQRRVSPMLALARIEFMAATRPMPFAVSGIGAC